MVSPPITIRAPRGLGALVLTLVLAWCVSPPALGLEPDQIALVVNSKVPASRELAEFYAGKRGIPAGRIIALDLPFPEEEMPVEQYDQRVVPAVRAFLNDNGLKGKVTCLVTFWGVPLRVGRRQGSPGDDEQVRVVQAELEHTRGELAAAVARAEDLAKELNPKFAPAAGNEPAQFAKRAGDALTAVAGAALGMPPGQPRATTVERMVILFEKLMGPAEAAQRLSGPELSRVAPPDQLAPERLARLRQQAANGAREFGELKAKPPSPQTLAAMRTLVRENFGLFRYYEVLVNQYATLETKETEAAFDSELSMLWWDQYPRHRWQTNTLHHRVRAVPAGTPQTLMVTRLDGPTEQSVDRLILSSMKVEKAGLKGQVVIDARGLKGDDGYGRYDSTLRRFAGLLKTKSTLRVNFDDTDALFQPGVNAPKDVAVYCGWYSLRNYVPAFTFSEGAVGFHVASAELVSLRTPDERGWVHGLIKDGVVGTLGPVAEPYLHAFPPADEFFPLLMTGELTLAEVYWKTHTLTSWMNTCVGDPLYRPYRVNPPLTADDLPAELRAALTKAPAPPPAAAPVAPAPAPTPGGR